MTRTKCDLEPETTQGLTAEEIGAVSGAAKELRFPFGIVFQFNDRGCWALWGSDKSNGPVKEGGCP